MSPILLPIAFLVLIYLAYSFVTTRGSKNFPPGPLRLPFVGGYLQVLVEDYKFIHVGLQKLSKKYESPIVGMYMAEFKVIVANSYETCKEIMTRPEFQGRPQTIITKTRAMGKTLGIFFDEGPNWLHQRRFSLRELRDFGFGRRSDPYEQVLAEEVQDMLSEMRKETENGRSIKIPDVFFPVMVNCIYHLLFNGRLPLSERETLKKFGRTLMQFMHSTDPIGRIVTLIPALRHAFPEVTDFKGVYDSSMKLWAFAEKQLRDHVQNFNEEWTRDFMDVYLKNMKSEPQFSQDHLIMSCVDLILPAAAASSQVSFVLMRVVQHPHVLEKCQEELDSVVGRDRMVTLDDRQYLPYTEATLRETLRISPIAPLGVLHKSTEDATYFGYDIPANTIMITNLHAMNMDEKFWGDPENFRPDRFLDYRGNLKKKDYTLPFGLGKRVCAGETFARQNMFVTMASIFQNFNVVEDTPIDFSKNSSGLIQSPHDNFYVKLVERE